MRLSEALLNIARTHDTKNQLDPSITGRPAAAWSAPQNPTGHNAVPRNVEALKLCQHQIDIEITHIAEKDPDLRRIAARSLLTAVDSKKGNNLH